MPRRSAPKGRCQTSRGLGEQPFKNAARNNLLKTAVALPRAGRRRPVLRVANKMKLKCPSMFGHAPSGLHGVGQFVANQAQRTSLPSEIADSHQTCNRKLRYIIKASDILGLICFASSDHSSYIARRFPGVTQPPADSKQSHHTIHTKRERLHWPINSLRHQLDEVFGNDEGRSVWHGLCRIPKKVSRFNEVGLKF